VTGVWRKLHDEELHKFYFLPSIIRMIKSRRMLWGGGTFRTNGGEKECIHVISGKAR
jgi:hypothetical protein